MSDEQLHTAAPKTPARGVYILPNLFTAASLFTAFLSLLLAHGGKMESAALAILFSALMDGLDGKVARLTNTASEFGVQFDSLADLVAFGVAPAFLLWVWILNDFGRFGTGICFLFVACAALRLARFNVSTAVTNKKFFIGLPSPAGGCSLALLVLFTPHIPTWLLGVWPYFVLTACLSVALLMVSRVRYFSFKEYGWVKTHPFKTIVVSLLLFVLIISAPRAMGFLLCLFYLLAGLIYSFVLLPQRNRQLINSINQNL